MPVVETQGATSRRRREVNVAKLILQTRYHKELCIKKILFSLQCSNEYNTLYYFPTYCFNVKFLQRYIPGNKKATAFRSGSRVTPTWIRHFLLLTPL